MTHTPIATAALLSSVALSLGAMAMNANAEVPGYLTDQRGIVVKNTYGSCWHTGAWNRDLAIQECDPDLVPAKVMAAPAPAPAAPAPMRAAEPAPVPPAAIAPVAVAPRAAPRREKVTLSVEALFAFGKAEIRPAAQTKLDDLVGKLRSIDPENIVIEGHADRLGRPAYNQSLSLRRAESIKDYLVANGIEPSDIQVVGKGERQPVTHASDCRGQKNQKLIACLQPDRRVEIDLVGTRIR